MQNMELLTLSSAQSTIWNGTNKPRDWFFTTTTIKSTLRRRKIKREVANQVNRARRDAKFDDLSRDRVAGSTVTLIHATRPWRECPKIHLRWRNANGYYRQNTRQGPRWNRKE